MKSKSDRATLDLSIGDRSNPLCFRAQQGEYVERIYFQFYDRFPRKKSQLVHSCKNNRANSTSIFIPLDRS